MESIMKLSDESLFKCKGYIDGRWEDAKSGETFEVSDPATGTVVAACPDMNNLDVVLAIEAAKRAQVLFGKSSAYSRSKMLQDWAGLMLANKEDLARIVTVENGKPLAEARGEIAYAAAFLTWFAEEAIRIQGETVRTNVDSHRVVTVREPVGVCGLITPWNFPAAMITRKAGPAIAAGCTTVVKAPGETPLTALALAELAERAGIPGGVFNVVTTLKYTPEVGRTITTSPIVRKISFTGSTTVGRLLCEQSSSTIKKMSLELGGLAPFIVFDDADIEAAVAGAVVSKFRASGQTCVCANTMFVHRSVYDRFAKGLIEVVKTFKVGNGLHSDTTHGPLIHQKAVSKVSEHVQDALEKGATVVVGGNVLPELGPTFFEPTVILNATLDMKFTQEEIFGPLAGIVSFETEEEVLAAVNRSEYGLAAYFYSRDISRCWRVAERLDVGMVGVNSGIVSNPASPFGGVKQSGYGREGSKQGIDEYTTVKSITFTV
ncbi:succinate-semialdehyde dehydrogenase [Aaosphaeria arxii CBS 175.79]|uniref:Succinate-semialdehyde dehydrogenase n=1 Tax=Aaosphaeria arxii CBS 175.79 TaxID=1450172 RepID=A0A6A5YCU3_9PLEO|nr:succinate-semialdehyde dehydrogenase [Aaosphaeria arxii CBS 175.79]KAF2022414.1 succinate-semialdehyde dehydrogenase [Aaosphaeria arxii CBS 175.79]